MSKSDDDTRLAAPATSGTNPADPDLTRLRPAACPISAYPVVPGYEVLGVLGRGGMGVVYKATQTAVSRVVALKTLPAGADASPTAEARFQIEAEAIATLQHPGVVQVFEFGRADGGWFLALEFVPGGTLADRIQAKPCSPREAAELVATLADAVHAAHAKGVLHRDLKPANVLLTETGEPKITDFGLARIGQSELTATGAVMGTPSYMSPEQASGDGKKVGTPADVWALGAILYELLVGRPPFRRDTVAATLHAVVHDTLESPRKLNRKVARDLETICLKCLQKDPADRYRTADALAADLRAYLGGFPVAARPVGFLRRTWKLVKRNPVRSALFAVVLITGVWIGAAWPKIMSTTPTVRSGVWVESDRDAVDAFNVADQSAAAYTYSGRPVEFWVELHRPGQPVRTVRAEPWETDPVEAVRQMQGQPAFGRWVWTRGKRDAKGDEVWCVGLKRSVEKPATGALPGVFGGTIANAFGGGTGKVTQTETDTCFYNGRRTVPFGKHPQGPNGSTWELGGGGVVNPVAEDQPVCLKDIDGGWGSGPAGDTKTTAYTIRVMCQVLTPEIAERLKADREAAKKAKAGEAEK